jgi:hypothetical protein
MPSGATGHGRSATRRDFLKTMGAAGLAPGGLRPVRIDRTGADQNTQDPAVEQFSPRMGILSKRVSERIWSKV